MNNIYNTYTDDEMITVPKKAVFADVDGFPNESAFRHFLKHLGDNDEYYLVCISIDLTASNEKKGYAYGTFVLRKVFLQLKDHFYIFRVNGDKFNLLIKKEDFDNAEKMLSNSVENLFTIYYGFVKSSPINKDNYTELRRQGVDLMYHYKAYKTGKGYKEIRDDKIIGNKGNTPLELQETKTHKFRDTMWYGTIRFEEISPNPREVTAYVFPTEFKEKLASLNMVVVVDDLVLTRVYTGNNVNFGFDGMRFSITSRFDNEGHLNIVCFKDRESKGECKMMIDAHEGICIPASFGKRVGKGMELFPVKSNSCGSYEYALWNKETNKAEIDTTGIVQIDDKNYAVHADSKGIDLIEQ